LIYDKKNQRVYDAFCIPRAVCIVAEGAPGAKMTLTTQSKGESETQFMLKNDDTRAFSVTFELAGNTLKYSEKTDLQLHGKPFTHVDSSTLVKASS